VCWNIQLKTDSAVQQGEQPPVRRLAELHYKASLALQFLHKASPAKEHTEARPTLCCGSSHPMASA
jgi:hypothetical protein